MGHDDVPGRPVDIYPDRFLGWGDAATLGVFCYVEREASEHLVAQARVSDVKHSRSRVAVCGQVERLVIGHADIFAPPAPTVRLS